MKPMLHPETKRMLIWGVIKLLALIFMLIAASHFEDITIADWLVFSAIHLAISLFFFKSLAKHFSLRKNK